jgi:hypothetical protein
MKNKKGCRYEGLGYQRQHPRGLEIIDTPPSDV